MKNYEGFMQEDFVQDPYFRKWVLGKLEEHDKFWDHWNASHPDKKELIEQAKSMVIGLDCEEIVVDRQEIGAAIHQIMRGVRRSAPLPFYRTKAFAAASVMLLALLGAALMWQYHTPAGDHRLFPLQQQQSVVWEVNQGKASRTIKLGDGSIVELLPESRLGIETGFGTTGRNVWLEGGAAFDVQKQPDNPFLVHSENVIVKVLGTTFQVKAYEKDDNVSVSVTSGKVTVQTRSDVGAQSAGELVLSPNQQAVISKKDDKIIKTLIETPVIIRQPDQYSKFHFTDTPISEVFKTLEEAYGITISYDPEVFQKCNLTARLTNEDLFEKLGLICETIQASYKITDGQLLIQGHGCD